jgi:hypothetical protein
MLVGSENLIRGRVRSTSILIIYILAFFHIVLKGQKELLLSGPSKAYPEVSFVGLRLEGALLLDELQMTPSRLWTLWYADVECKNTTWYFYAKFPEAVFNRYDRYANDGDSTLHALTATME